MNPQFKTVFFVFKMVMSFVYVALGLSFMFKPESMGAFIPAQYMPILGALLIVYGLFRGYRAYIVDRKG